MPASQVKITGEIHADVLEKARKTVIENTVATAELPGFRAGKAPEAMVLSHVGEGKILERAAERVLNDSYSEILEENNIRAIGTPMISVTKLAAGNPLGFAIITAVMPEIALGDYHKLAKEAAQKNPITEPIVDEKDIDAFTEDLKKQIGEQQLGTLGDTTAIREKIKESLLNTKKTEMLDKRRAAIADALIDNTKFEIPEMIVESELEQMVGQFRADIERNGVTYESYLKEIKKTEDEIRKEWHSSAERRARLELILKKIAREEKVELPDEQVKTEVDQIVSQHKNVDRFRARMYVENILTNKKVFEILENL